MDPTTFKSVKIQLAGWWSRWGNMQWRGVIEIGKHYRQKFNVKWSQHWSNKYTRDPQSDSVWDPYIHPLKILPLQSGPPRDPVKVQFRDSHIDPTEIHSEFHNFIPQKSTHISNNRSTISSTKRSTRTWIGCSGEWVQRVYRQMS